MEAILSEFERALVGTYRLSMEDSDPTYHHLGREVGAATLGLHPDRSCVWNLDPPGTPVGPFRWSASETHLTLVDHGSDLVSLYRWQFDGGRLRLIDRPGPSGAPRAPRVPVTTFEDFQREAQAMIDGMRAAERDGGGARQWWVRVDGASQGPS